MCEDQQFDVSQLASGVSPATFKANRVEPKLSFLIVACNMHVGQLGFIARVEEEAIRADTQDRGHDVTATHVPAL